MKLFIISLLVFTGTISSAQPSKDYWQQRVSYTMDIDMDAANNQFKGKQQLVYFNNSPDTLYKVYYHLYFNAFQPNSMMDERSRTILDPDRRVRDRIFHLKPDEIGYHEVKYLTQNGKPTTFIIEGTTMEVELAEPILPGAETIFIMEFNSQVPLQIRRSGRDNAEGVRLSMTQWYPKMAEYDKNGWHTSPYIGREFYGVYGEFNVNISIDSAYTIGGTGVLQNPKEVGHGYAPQSEVLRPTGKKLTWNFYANNVHDFAWAADPEYDHYIVKGPNDMDIHIIWKKGNYDSNWRKLGALTAKTIAFQNEHFGVYPYPQFTVIQGGDGGMEYPMATLITGGRSMGGLVGVMVHELTHMWYYGVLGFNESYLSWMDEGFTEYATDEAIAHLYDDKGDPHLGAYGSYLFLKYRQFDEPMTTHADQYDTNSGYSTSAYSNGNIFLNQLGYIVGKEVMRKSLLRFYNEWKFKHPTPEDLIHIVEKESGMVLDWYLDHWTKSTHTIDYALIGLEKNKNGTAELVLERKGDHPMPVDVLINYEDGTSEFYTIPLVSMRGEKKTEGNLSYMVAKDWPWTHKEYRLPLKDANKKIKKIEIDPSLRMADVNRLNNTWPFANDRKFMEPARATWNTYGSSWRPSLFFGENSGAMIGAHSYGSYIFNQFAYEASFNLTSGNVDAYDVNKTDVDYTFRITLPTQYSGSSSTVTLEALRYYGVFQNQLTFQKHIGKYGAWSKEKRLFKFSLFHQEKTANRMVSQFSNWSRNAVVGSRLSYEIGNYATSGILITSQMATAGKTFGASYLTFGANNTKNWTKAFSTRFGFTVATGSKTLPNQYRITAAGPTLEGAWNNPTFFGIANISASFTQDAHLAPTGGNGLVGYGLAGIGSPDIAGNNHFSAVIWNDWKPFSGKWTKPATFEFVSGFGKSWNGEFINDSPLSKNATDKVLLASMFVGLSYDASSLPMFDKWRPQSSFIRNLNFSVRMPFFMNGLQGRDDWNTLLVFGVSNSF